MTNEGADSVIVWANWHQFGPGDVIVHPCVESRMLLWCQSGRGTLRLNGEEQSFEMGDWIFLPWRRRLIHESDQQNPLLVAGIHIVPHHRPDVPIEFTVEHNGPREPLRNPSRRDWEPSFFPGVRRGRMEKNDRLSLLATYVVEKFQSEEPQIPVMRSLAQLVINEVKAASHHPATGLLVPGPVHRMQEYVRSHISTALSVEKLAEVSGLSVASVHRLFWKYTGTSPARWIAQERTAKASRLLRTTRLPLREIGEQIGLPDPFHFSRFFKRQTGLAPSDYRTGRLLF